MAERLIGVASPYQVLVVGPAWVGDMVMAQSLFITLKRARHDVAIDVLAPRWSLPLLERMPEVRRGIELPVAHRELGLGKRWRLGRELRGRGYDQAIVLPRSYKAALVPLFAHIPRRTGYRGEWRYGAINDVRPLDKALLTQTVQRFVALGLDAGASLPPPIAEPHLRIDEERRAQLAKSLGLRLDAPVVAFMPGAEYGPAKRWPPEHYRRLGARLNGAGFRVWLFGSAKEQELAESIALPLGEGAVNLCGKTALEDAVDLLSLARAAVTNDSGLMHVAAAVGIPLLALYGSSTPDYTPPLSTGARYLYRGLDCSPCFQRQCRFGDTRCLSGIGHDEVYETLVRLLAESEPHLGVLP